MDCRACVLDDAHTDRRRTWCLRERARSVMVVGAEAREKGEAEDVCLIMIGPPSRANMKPSQGPTPAIAHNPAVPPEWGRLYLCDRPGVGSRPPDLRRTAVRGRERRPLTKSACTAGEGVPVVSVCRRGHSVSEQLAREVVCRVGEGEAHGRRNRAKSQKAALEGICVLRGQSPAVATQCLLLPPDRLPQPRANAPSVLIDDVLKANTGEFVGR